MILEMAHFTKTPLIRVFREFESLQKDCELPTNVTNVPKALRQPRLRSPISQKISRKSWMLDSVWYGN